jgi:isocitrate lyase
VAADANTALQTYPDQSLYPADSVPKVVERINNVRGGVTGGGGRGGVKGGL